MTITLIIWGAGVVGAIVGLLVHSLVFAPRNLRRHKAEMDRIHREHDEKMGYAQYTERRK